MPASVPRRGAAAAATTTTTINATVPYPHPARLSHLQPQRLAGWAVDEAMDELERHPRHWPPVH